MFKKLLPLLIITILVIAMLGGCETFKFGPVTGGDANAIVTNNGGLAVKQGDYIYFINGYSDYDAKDPKTNFFGEVVKGALMRGRLSNGELVDVVTVVPKKIMSSSPDHGFSVFGEWIYYVSPGTGTDNKGNVLIEYIDFFRTKIDGTKTERITTVKGNTTRYKYTRDALVYYSDNKLISIDLTSKKFKETTIDEEVVSVLFPNNPVFDPANPTSSADNIFYTKKSESDLDLNNVVYVVNANGSGKKVLIDKNTYTADLSQLTEIYTISLLGSSVTEGKLAIYYTKKTVATIANQDRGLFGYEFADTSMAFIAADEKQFSLTTTTKIFPVSFSEGVFILDETPNVLALAMGEGDLIPTKITYNFPSGITMLGIATISNKQYAIYLSGTSITRFPLDKSENAAIMITDKIKTGWAGPNFIGEYMFYINEVDYSYTYMANLSTFSITDKDAFVNKMIGQMNQKDADAKKAAEEEE